jgi:hypothetical protein
MELEDIAFVLDFDKKIKFDRSELVEIKHYGRHLGTATEDEMRAIEDHLKYKINEDDIKEEDPHRLVADIFGNLKDQVAKVQSAVADVKEAVDEIQTPGSLWLAYQRSGKYEDMTRWLKHAAWERLDPNTKAGNWTWVELARITQSPPAPSEGEKPELSNREVPTMITDGLQTDKVVGIAQTMAPKNASGPVTTSSTKTDPKVQSTQTKPIPSTRELLCSPKAVNDQIWKLRMAGKEPKEIGEILSAAGTYWSERMVMNRINKLKAEKEESCVQP